MPYQAKFSENELISFFEQFGNDIDSTHVKKAAEHLGVKVQSVTKRMNKIAKLQKRGRGKWCLTTQEIINAYEAPAAQLVGSVSMSRDGSDAKKFIKSSALVIGAI